MADEGKGGVREAKFLDEIPVDVVIELGRTRMLLRELAGMQPDDVIELKQATDQPLEFVVSGRVLARGELVMKGERMAIRITELVGRTAEEEA